MEDYMKLNKALFLMALVPTLATTNISRANALSCADDPFCAMQARMDMMLNNDFFAPYPARSYSYLSTDIINEAKDMIIKVDMPGVDKKNIEVNLSDYTLSISGKRVADTKDKAVAERSYGEFKRIIQLPAKADVDNAKTKYENGVLEITIPKLQPEQTKSKKLAV